MLSLLADSAPTPPPGTSEWLAVLAFLLWIANSGWNLVTKAKGPQKQQREIVNQPLEVQEAAQFATTHELKRVEHDLDQKIRLLFKKSDQLHDHLTATKDAILRSGEERLGAITHQINSMTGAVHEKIDDSFKEAYHRINDHGERIAAVEARTGCNADRRRARD